MCNFIDLTIFQIISFVNIDYKFMTTTMCFVECFFPYHLNWMDLELNFFLVVPSIQRATI